MPCAIITASDSGIGKATALALARRGHDVGITWHADEDGARETAREAQEAGVRAEVRRLDLLQRDTVASTIAELADALGGLDVLVNNAGRGSSTPALEISLDEWQRVLDISLTGAFLASKEAGRRMVAAGRGGRIVNVTSVHEHVPLEGAAPYCAAKGGLGMLTKVLALELARHGITVNSVAPGEIATPMTGNEDVDPRTVERPGIPAGRPGDAREIAATVAFLASPEAAYLTGQSIVVNGGMTLMAAVANQIAMEAG